MMCASCLEGLFSITRHASQRHLSSSKRAVATAIETSLLRVWRHRALANLFPADEAVLLHIIDYIGDLSPPRLAAATKSGIVLGLSQDAPMLQGSQNLAVFAIDSSGSMVLAGVPNSDPHIRIWDLCSADIERRLRGTVNPRTILRSPQFGEASCIWLNLLAERLAVGSKHAAVQVWDLQTGVLLANCIAQILESTRWTTVGHMHEITVLKNAPLERFWEISSGRSFLDYTPKAGNACVASADCCGVVCLWRDDAYPVMTVNASWEAQKLGLLSGNVTDLASAPGLLVCSLPDAIVGFAAPEHTALFVLSTNAACLSAWPNPGPLLAISVLSDRRLIAFTARGALLLWDIPDLKSFKYDSQQADIAAKSPQVLAVPDCIHAEQQAVASCSDDNFCWISSTRHGEAEIRWVAPTPHGPRAFHGSVRTVAHPLMNVALLPQQRESAGCL